MPRDDGRWFHDDERPSPLHSRHGRAIPRATGLAPFGQLDRPGAYTITFWMRLVKHWRWFVVLAACVAGCRAGPPLNVTSIQLGRSLNDDGTVGKFATTFAPGETVYVSVRTAGAGDATISVRWTYEGRVVADAKKPVSFKDVAATEFHLQGVTGLPPGHYTVEVFMNGQSVETRKFTVEKR
jgi:hypothetical protein